MADSIRKRNSWRHAGGALLLMLALTHTASGAKAPALEGDFTWSADVLNSDFRSDTLDLSGNVRVSQGPMSIEAQSAKARDVRADTSRWTFQNAVRIRTSEADLQSNVATAAVINGQISDAKVEGSPARFEQVGGTGNRQVRGRAGVIEYDVGTGVVKMTNQVWFSNGKDEFRGDVVIYNVRDERLQINPGSSSNRVRGTIRPNQKSNVPPGGAGGTAAIVEPQFEGDEQEHLATDGGGA